MTATAKFAEYVTSGTFQLGLSRNQISALAMMAVDGGTYIGSAGVALERKGLVAAVHDPCEMQPDRLQYRLTWPGLLALDMLRAAGLVNSEGDARAAELASLTEELARLRGVALEQRDRAISALARKQKLAVELDNERRRSAAYAAALLATGIRHVDGFKLTINIGARDKRPDLADDDLTMSFEEFGEPAPEAVR